MLGKSIHADSFRQVGRGRLGRLGEVVRVGQVRESIQTHSSWSGEGVRVNSFGQGGRGCLCKIIWVGQPRESVSTRLGGSGECVHVNSFGKFRRGHSRVNETILKMLSCDLNLVLCTFMQLVYLALPCHFIPVMWVPM